MKSALKTFPNCMPKIRQLRNQIANNQLSYINNVVINPSNVTSNTISIVMTTHNRVEQTLFTLETIANSNYNDLQVIIVDDSTDGYIPLESLSAFQFQIDYITIDPKQKTWINPCVNYNIGFKEAKGGKIIIQNSEVCHVGDVISYVARNLEQGSYLSFDVKALNSFKLNSQFYKVGTNYSKVSSFLNSHNSTWYQHHCERNVYYHFLTAITRKDFERLGSGFDWDFSFGASWDDNELVARIKRFLKLNINNIKNETNKIMGIHQFHSKSKSNNAYEMHHRQINKQLFVFKNNWYAKNGNWIYLTNYSIPQVKLLLA